VGDPRGRGVWGHEGGSGGGSIKKWLRGDQPLRAMRRKRQTHRQNRLTSARARRVRSPERIGHQRQRVRPAGSQRPPPPNYPPRRPTTRRTEPAGTSYARGRGRGSASRGLEPSTCADHTGASPVGLRGPSARPRHGGHCLGRPTEGRAVCSTRCAHAAGSPGKELGTSSMLATRRRRQPYATGMQGVVYCRKKRNAR